MLGRRFGVCVSALPLWVGRVIPSFVGGYSFGIRHGTILRRE